MEKKSLENRKLIAAMGLDEDFCKTIEPQLKNDFSIKTFQLQDQEEVGKYLSQVFTTLWDFSSLEKGCELVCQFDKITPQRGVAKFAVGIPKNKIEQDIGAMIGIASWIDPKDSQKEIAKAIEIQQKFFETSHILAEKELDFERTVLQKDFSQAENIIKEMIAHDERCSDYWLMLGFASYMIGDYKETEKCFEESLKANVINPKANAAYVNFLTDQKQYQKAKDIWIRVKEFSQDLIEKILGKNLIYYAPESQLIPKIIKRLCGTNFTVKFYDSCTKALINTNHIDDALKLLTDVYQSTKLDKVKAFSSIRQGQVELHLNHKNLALDLFKKAWQLDNQVHEEIKQLTAKVGLNEEFERAINQLTIVEPLPEQQPPPSQESPAPVFPEAVEDKFPEEESFVNAPSQPAPELEIEISPKEESLAYDLTAVTEPKEESLAYDLTAVTEPKVDLTDLVEEIEQNKDLHDLNVKSPEDDQITGESGEEKKEAQDMFDTVHAKHPHGVEVRKAIDIITSALKDDKVRKKRDNTIIDENMRGKFLIYHHDFGAAANFSRYLYDLGALDIQIIEEIDDLYSLYKEMPIKALISWYEPNKNYAIRIMTQLMEDREIERSIVLLFVAGHDAIRDFVMKGAQLFVDNITVVSRTRSAFDRGLQKAIEQFNTPNTSTTAFYELRKVWRDPMIKERQALTEDQFKMLAERVNKMPGKAIWVRAESVLQKLLQKESDQAFREAEQLIKDFPESFDAYCIYHVAKTYQAGTTTVAKEICENIKEMRRINEERLYRLGKLFLKWNQLPCLAALLNFWDNQEHLKKDHQFYFLAGSYFYLKKEKAKARVFINYAVSKRPLRYEYIQQFALILEMFKDFRRAEDIWRVALDYYRADPIQCKLGMARCCAMLRKIRIGDNLIAEILQQDPKNKEALAIRKKHFLQLDNKNQLKRKPAA